MILFYKQERHDESGVNITQYVIAIEKVIMSAKAAVKEIQHVIFLVLFLLYLFDKWTQVVIF